MQIKAIFKVIFTIYLNGAAIGPTTKDATYIVNSKRNKNIQAY